MSIIEAIALFIVGLGLVIYFAEQLVKGLVGASRGFGISAFLISVIFLGFDPENLAVGAVGSWEQTAGIALGSIIGACMVAIALAFGTTALVAPMTFERVSRPVLVVPVLAVILLGGLGWDGQLSRIDGGILLAGFVLAIGYLGWLSKRGADIKAGGEVAETLEKTLPDRWKALGLMLFALLAIVVGSAMLVRASESLLQRIGLSGTYFGMVILALLVSIEELARELPAAWKGRSEISFGNVAGSILAFFLFNAGIIALVSPVEVGRGVLYFYLPVCLGTVIVVSLFILRGRIGRVAGGVLILLYLSFAVGGYFFGVTPVERHDDEHVGHALSVPRWVRT